MSPVRANRPDRDINSLDGNTQGMGLIVLEAALALAVLIFLIWWTMFSGRRDGELHDEAADTLPGRERDAPAGSAASGEPIQPPERGGTRNDQG